MSKYIELIDLVDTLVADKVIENYYFYEKRNHVNNTVTLTLTLEGKDPKSLNVRFIYEQETASTVEEVADKLLVKTKETETLLREGK